MGKPVKFSFQEKVEIISGFFRGQKGHINKLEIIKRGLFRRKEKHKYYVSISSLFNSVECDEEQIESLDNRNVEFNKKLIDIVNSDEEDE